MLAKSEANREECREKISQSKVYWEGRLDRWGERSSQVTHIEGNSNRQARRCIRGGREDLSDSESP